MKLSFDLEAHCNKLRNISITGKTFSLIVIHTTYYGTITVMPSPLPYKGMDGTIDIIDYSYADVQLLLAELLYLEIPFTVH